MFPNGNIGKKWVKRNEMITLIHQLMYITSTATLTAIIFYQGNKASSSSDVECKG